MCSLLYEPCDKQIPSFQIQESPELGDLDLDSLLGRPQSPGISSTSPSTPSSPISTLQLPQEPPPSAQAPTTSLHPCPILGAASFSLEPPASSLALVPCFLAAWCEQQLSQHISGSDSSAKYAPPKQLRGVIDSMQVVPQSDPLTASCPSSRARPASWAAACSSHFSHPPCPPPSKAGRRFSTSAHGSPQSFLCLLLFFFSKLLQWFPSFLADLFAPCVTAGS